MSNEQSPPTTAISPEDRDAFWAMWRKIKDTLPGQTSREAAAGQHAAWAMFKLMRGKTEKEKANP